MARQKSNQTPGAPVAPKVPRQTGYAVTVKMFIPADTRSLESMSAALDKLNAIKAGDFSGVDPGAVETKFTSRIPPPIPVAEA